MNRTTLIVPMCAALVGLGGCDGGERIESSVQAVSTENALSYNRLSMNLLSMNLLSMNRLSMNRLSMNLLSMNSLDSGGLETTDEGRELLRYTARCALHPSDTLVATVNGTDHLFPGLLNVAPEWEHRALTAGEERLLSACLVAHVNAYGVSVPVSMRAPGVLLADSNEHAAFPVYEATFFGNVFDDDSLKVYGCTGSNAAIANVHSADRSLRVCSDDSTDCEIVSVGRCKDVCDTRTRRYGWQDCHADGAVYPETVSVYLRDADIDNRNRTCASGTCDFSAQDGSDAVLDCSDASSCTTRCDGAAVCTLIGADAPQFVAHAANDATTEIDCAGAGNCAADCRGGSSCELDCFGAGSCDVVCEQGAQCLLDCTGSTDCGFTYCQGTVTACAGDVLACNRACPESDGAAAPPPSSCTGSCGAQSPDGCWCDDQCDAYGDCCADRDSTC